MKQSLCLPKLQWNYLENDATPYWPYVTSMLAENLSPRRGGVPNISKHWTGTKVKHGQTVGPQTTPTMAIICSPPLPRTKKHTSIATNHPVERQDRSWVLTVSPGHAFNLRHHLYSNKSKSKREDWSWYQDLFAVCAATSAALLARVSQGSDRKKL